MKRRNLVMAILAVVLVLGMSVGTAWAYFTDTTYADGFMVINVKPETELHEDVPDDHTKVISVENTSDMVPVFVRVRVYTTADYEAGFDKAKWVKDDGWFVYKSALDPKAITDSITLNIKFNKHPYEEDPVNGIQFLDGYEENVVVIYECMPANGDVQDAIAAWK